MGLKKTRKLISFALATVIAISTCVTALSIITSTTLASKSFVINTFITDEVAEQCDLQLSSKFKALEAKSGIPQRVFEMVKTDYNTKEMLELEITNAYTNEDTSLYNKGLTSYFNKMCIEYLEGNDIDYNAKNVKLTAKEANQIYTDCVYLQGTDTLIELSSKLTKACAKLGSLAIFIAIICVLLLVNLYTNKKNSFAYILYGTTGAGIASFIAGVLALATGAGKNFAIFPAIFQQAVFNMLKIYYVAIIITGLIITAISAFMLALIIKKYNKKSTSNHTII